MTRTAVDQTLKVFHNSGRWDRSDELLERNVRRLRRGGRSIGTRTEMSSRDFKDELHWPEDGWGHFHPMTDFGLANCSIEWDKDLWERVSEEVLQLTEIRVRTQKGHLQPPSLMPIVVLRHQVLDLELEVSTAHMNLHNTPLRDKAWHEEAATANAHWRRSRRKHPDRQLLFMADVNRTQRLVSNQRLLAREMQHGAGLHNLWVGNLPAAGGTHGHRAVLDVALSTMPGRSYLLDDDASSDHRPFGSDINLPRRSR